MGCATLQRRVVNNNVVRVTALTITESVLDIKASHPFIDFPAKTL